MAWYTTELEKAVYDRMAADTTLGGLIDGAWSVRAPDSAKTYVVWALDTASSEQEAFRTLAHDVVLTVAVVVPSEGVGGVDPRDLMGQINTRIYGNWYEKAVGVQPDYGLARWSPTLASWGIDVMEFDTSGDVDAGVNRLAHEFRFITRITKEGA